MRSVSVLSAALFIACHAMAADVLTEKLQRGLFEEEANHNLDAAIKEYQSVVTQSDEQRKVIATALFRLGECYRKLGKTNEANAQYARILRDFSEQEQLVKLSQDFLGPPRTNGRIQVIREDDEAQQLARWREQVRDNPDLVNKLELGPPLHSAIQKNQRELVEFLLNSRADINGQDMSQQIPLHVAVVNNRRAIVDLLLERGANVNALDNYRDTPLHKAASAGFLSLAQRLIDAKADMNVFNGRHETPLMIAVARRYHAMTELLLKRGADPNFGAKNGGYTVTSPISVAIAGGNADLVRLLVTNKADVNLPGDKGETPLLQAARGKRTEIIKVLLAANADPAGTDAAAFTPLMAAAEKGSSEIVKLLLDGGANPNAMSGGGTALHLAAQNGHDESVRLLLDRGANINARTNQNATALFLAVQKRYATTVRALLEHGANPNLVSDGSTPLDYAKAQARGNSHSESALGQEIIELLLKHGANPYLSRQQWIGYGRSTTNTTVFFRRATNDWNRYTLFELLADTFREFPFPDLEHARISRVDGTRLKDIPLNLNKLFAGDSCSNDLWLEWGDTLIIPELDHKLDEPATYFPTNAGPLLERCLERTVRIIVKRTTNTMELARGQVAPRGEAGFRVSSLSLPGGEGTFVFNTEEPADEPPPKRMFTFRLKEVVLGSRLLRASSELSRVTVSRPGPAGKTSQWTVDLTKIATPNEWPERPGNPIPPNARGKLSWRYDLWLRDGDVIEIPEKQ